MTKNQYENSIFLPNGYIERGLVLVVMGQYSKRPVPHPRTGGWWHIRTKYDFAEAWATIRDCNWAMDCQLSGVVQVDSDSDQALEWAIERGLKSEGAWVLFSRRGPHVLYKAVDDTLPAAHTDKDHLTVDIGVRLSLIPPSVHPSGHEYRWAEGHSPFDIPLGQLASLPSALVTAWRELKAPKPRRMEQTTSPPTWLGLVYEAIVSYIEREGGRLRFDGNGGMVGRCPLHDDHNPSLNIHPERGWICFAGCGEGRLTLLAHRLGISLLEDRL